MSTLSGARHNGAILVVLLVAQLLLMSGSVRGAEGSTLLESWLMRASAPLVTAGQAVGGVFGRLGGSVRGLFTARSRNVELEAELRDLRDEVVRQREAALENERLRALLGMRRELVPRSIGASVVTATLDEQTQMIVVDRGTAEGVTAELAVVTWGGAVGRVLVAEPRHSKVLLVTDPNSGVAGLVQRSRAQGIVFGTGGHGLDLRFVPKYADVMHGDRVVTSGLDGIFPRGFGLGRVSAISETVDGAQTVHLEPELDFGALEEVLIVLDPAGGGLVPSVETGAGS